MGSSDKRVLEIIDHPSSATPSTASCACSTPPASLSSQAPPPLVKNLTTVDGKVITHGYVHGHIHKHKDHTHIHGHIHNHDHLEYNRLANEQRAQQAASTDLQTNFNCNEFESLDFCKDVFCDELDDCFFLNCDDSKYSNSCDLNCCNSSVDEICCSDANCLADKNDHPQSPSDCCNNPDCGSYSVCHSTGRLSSTICTDPNCTEVDACCGTPEKQQQCHHPQHAADNNLCELQLSKKPIFEDLISNIHSSYKNQNRNEIPLPPKKKPRTQTDFEIHFPHECHPEDTARPVETHQVHQSCFHTTIPDSENTPTEYDQKLMSDFDFVIQFNNFNQFLNDMSNNQHGATATPPVNHSTNIDSAIPVPSTSMSTPSNGAILDHPTHATTGSPLLYSCQWEKCFKRVNAETFLNHVVEDHLEHELTGKQPSESTFQCEWSDCNFMNNDYNSLIDHLKSHQPSKFILPTQSTSVASASSTNALTPLSCSISNAASPKVLQQPAQAQPTVGEFNITSMKIMPKTRKKQAAQDPEFTCHWQVGVDENGQPIACNCKHENEGDLQNHMLEEHIGSGKSKYYCEWIGCERHNGKLFTQRQKLIRHIHIHTNYKPCKCDICGACFAVKPMLEQHLRIHSGEKPFECSICGKKFATSSSLSIHNRVHTGERPMVCTWPGCNKRFSESSNLTKHMKIHTKTYDCEICGKSFEKKASFTRHVSQHSKEEKTMLKREKVVSMV
ncbi:Zinc-responsive transcriptional regulator ZAP1 [Candida viswanathii]|uniref:Zinc-responsive transcriptional regulator ZAP1 n=1 Tax=Candida viswanathii TaxID=5486 RepID=A0A367XRL2_9ASCO|nr:Zinc-responsive transcriptional regulator ZAP1 [Candida viswanathii]